jgi:hypothetical protein
MLPPVALKEAAELLANVPTACGALADGLATGHDGHADA